MAMIRIFTGRLTMKTFKYTRSLSAAVLVLTAVTSTSVLAGQMDETIVKGSAVPTRTVKFARSELATAEGRAVVERRIERAARVVCGSNDHHVVGTLHAVARNEACYERAVNKAMAQLGGDRVAAID
jgi:UrcA family protein